MRGDRFFTQLFGQSRRGSFRQSSRVNKNERGTVLFDKLFQATINFIPGFIRHHRFQWRTGHLNGQITLTDMTSINDGTGTLDRIIVLSGQIQCHVLDRFLGGGNANTHRWPFTQLRQTLQAQGQVSTAFITRQRMNFINDYTAHGFQDFTARIRRQ